MARVELDKIPLVIGVLIFICGIAAWCGNTAFLKQSKEFVEMASKVKAKKEETFWVIGQLYFIRTVTLYHVGELVSIDDHEITLRDAAWVVDTGRFSEALKTGQVAEVEPFPDGISVVGRGALVDAGRWPHPPLRSVI